MNIKKAAMMLTIMLITILSASSFYILTGEAELNKNIIVNSSTGTRIEKYHDYEFVYTDKSEDPYTSSNGKKYYIRYTGAESGRTVVDLDEEGYGLTIENGLPTVNGTTLTSTYKLFSKRNVGKNTEVTRIFVPSSIAIDGDKDTAVLQSDGLYTFDENKGITSNTFLGYEKSAIDVIYHTGQLTATANGNNVISELDRTTKISKDTYPNITTYVYLGSENVVRSSTSDISTSYSYTGKVKDVFVSNEINNISNMFYHGSGTLINHVLLDTRTEWKGYKSFIALFYNQTELQLPDNFQIPEGIQVLKNMFYGCTTIKTLPTQMEMPDTTTNIEGMFYSCTGLTSISNSFQISDKVTNTAQMFYGCTSLESIPENYKIPSIVTTMQEMFYGCTKLKGSVLIDCTGTTLSNITNAFYNVGTSASNYKKCNTPLIVRYPVANATIDNYTVNVYTPQTTGGKVTMLPTTNNNDTTQWEKIYEDGAPNYDENGAYYIRYKGTDTTVYMDAVDRQDKGVNNKGFDIEFSAGTKNPCILNTKLRSTYKMFSKSGKDGAVNTEVERVFLPNAVAIYGDSGLSGGMFNDNGIASNTFNGYENSTIEKDVIYHSGSKLKTMDRGGGLSTEFNRTTKIDKNTYPCVAVYVYLGIENFTRIHINPTSWSASTQNTHSARQYAYLGLIPNVYVSKEITYIVGLFGRYYYDTHDSYWSPSNGTEVNKVLLDEDGIWASFAGLFMSQKSLDLPEKFSIPNKGKNVYDLVNMFSCSNISHVPKNISIPSTATLYFGMFLSCENLSGTIELPMKSQAYSNQSSYLFYGGTGSKATSKDPTYGTSIVVKCYQGSPIDTYVANSAYIHKVYYGGNSSSQSSTNNTITNVQDATNKIVIEDCTEKISVKVNEVNSQKLCVEDETDCVSVTVNKSVKENESEEDENQQ